MLKLATLPLQTHCWIANVLQDDVHSSNTVALSRVIRFAGSCKVYKVYYFHSPCYCVASKQAFVSKCKPTA